MPALRLLTVVSASLFLLARAQELESEQQSSTTTTYSVSLDHDNACLSDINAARKDAGFDEFIAATANDTGKRLPQASNPANENDSTWVWKPVCSVLIPGETTGQGDNPAATKAFTSGTYAFQVVDASIPSCSAVVDNWKKAYTNFNGLPPPYTEGTALYKKQENVSLVAIYNPTEKATADCRVVTCTKTVETTPTDPVQQHDDGSQKKETVTKGFALICMTTPDVLTANKETAPFTEEQWGKIVASIKGSASTVLPSLFGLAAAILGVMVAL